MVKGFTHFSVPALQHIKVCLRLQEVLLSNCKKKKNQKMNQNREIQKREGKCSNCL